MTLEVFPRDATYLDGSPVKPGDSIRYRQAPGGMLPRSENWKYGIAKNLHVPVKDRENLDKITSQWGYLRNHDVLSLFDGERYFHISGHEVERV